MRSVEVDRAGELLRVFVERTDVGPAVQRDLFDLGFASSAIEDGVPSGTRWYGPNDVFELSAEEASVIAARIVPAFARTHAVPDPERLRGTVADALFACFRYLTGRPAGQPRAGSTSSAAAVTKATEAALGLRDAEDLGRLVQMDLDRGKDLGNTT